MSQRALVLRLLREAGSAGVDTHELIYVYGITQPASRINELRNDGHDITTIDRGTADNGKKRLCTYILKGAPGRKITAQPEDPAKPLSFDCGCVRSASGMGWDKRCERHAA